MHSEYVSILVVEVISRHLDAEYLSHLQLQKNNCLKNVKVSFIEMTSSGIINVLKPAGVTSNYVVTKIKKQLNVKKIGHLGTLDPSGAGVLPICINKATKLFDFYLNKDKIYRAVFVFGKETDTLDSDGNVTNAQNIDVAFEEIEGVIKDLCGKINQIPPKYSAKNVNGKRAYELARNNEEFESRTQGSAQ